MGLTVKNLKIDVSISPKIHHFLKITVKKYHQMEKLGHSKSEIPYTFKKQGEKRNLVLLTFDLFQNQIRYAQIKSKVHFDIDQKIVLLYKNGKMSNKSGFVHEIY